MQTTVQIKNEYNSLDTLNTYLNAASDFTCSKEYDIWEMRTDANGQMEQCLVLKKSSMHAAKLYFTSENKVKVDYVIPNKIMNAYFGKSVKARRSILEIVGGIVKSAILKAPQEKAFNELTQVIEKASN
tara:strand:- start:886 stop:1272 length:387 start_codon:yes stop_codon:yes gene_type:complete